MRYFIYYPPNNSLRRVDVADGTSAEAVINMVKHKFGINENIDSQGKTSIVLNYNGTDLKPAWPLTDLGVPSGAIIRCYYRDKKTAKLYVHCEFNNQIVEFFDDAITAEITIGEIRKKISDRIGLPLTTFCLEMQDNEQRLLDHMKIFRYDLKPNDHVYLKVWRGYENFLNSCMKGFSKCYSRDDLTRHYQLQIALHISAFYGFMALGSSALQLGARSDYPVGEHPSRQWSSETTVKVMPEMLKCPIHIAIERGQMKMVDLFVRQSLLCTQTLHPISGFLPYRLALSLSISSKSKVERQRYSQIYLYLYDKQFNLRIPLNTNSDCDSNVFTASKNNNSWHQPSKEHHFLSLPRYCKMIRWYDRARERVWKKYGVPIDSSVEIKRASQSKGLLGYKVLIDGFNNTFDASNLSTCSVTSSKRSQIDQTGGYSGQSDEEREQTLKMKAYMKQFVAAQQRRGTLVASNILHRSRHLPLLAQHGLMGTKMQVVNLAPAKSSALLGDLVSSSEFSHSQDRSSLIDQDYQYSKYSLDSESSLNIDTTPSVATNTVLLKLNENQHGGNRKAKPMTKTTRKIVGPVRASPSISVIYEKNEHKQQENRTTLPTLTPTSNASTIQPMWKKKLRTVVSANVIPHRQEKMSSVAKFLSSSMDIPSNGQQQKIAVKRDLLKPSEQSSPTCVEKSTTKSSLIPVTKDTTIVDIDCHKSHLDYETKRNIDSVQSRSDLNIQQATIKTYERHASASIHETAVECLQEAGFFKRKSCLKQIEISREMVKQRTKRIIQRPNGGKRNSVLVPMRAISAAPSLYTTQPSTSKAN